MTLKLALLLALAAGAASAAPVAGDPARGKQLYVAHGCYGCHGYGGQTGVRALVGTGSPIVANPQAFVFYLRQRGEIQPMIPSALMPRYSERSLPDRDALDVYAYVRSFVLDAPDPKTNAVMQRLEASAAKPYTPGK